SEDVPTGEGDCKLQIAGSRPAGAIYGRPIDLQLFNFQLATFNLQFAISLSELGSGQLQERLMKVELARLEAGHFADRNVARKLGTVLVAIKVKNLSAAVGENHVHFALDVFLSQCERRI